MQPIRTSRFLLHRRVKEEYTRSRDLGTESVRVKTFEVYPHQIQRDNHRQLYPAVDKLCAIPNLKIKIPLFSFRIDFLPSLACSDRAFDATGIELAFSNVG
jgi:hypothetical protein